MSGKLTLNTDDPIGSPSGTSATNGRLRKAGSLSLRSRRLTYTVALAEERSGGVPPEEGRHNNKNTYMLPNRTDFTLIIIIAEGEESLKSEM